ncbi:TonB-dependent receptor [Sphingomonas sp.]|uniref:TonB-dependent receptor n=1 Tax=Sphingomonas sp. TaxID=28214 RepID=UPI001AFDBA6B|nr:TonB-dependent receptor [Sphingomonas sp.]MBO9714549.1 TonB-dependent receptor [Sphingomonas sp.]
MNMRHRKHAILTGSTVTAIMMLFAFPAFAQENTSNDTDSGNDIVVTALKRSTNIQETPLAITAVTGETLADMGITDSAQLSRVAPGLVFRENPNGGARAIIRNVQSAGESTVGVYYDETPLDGSVGTTNDAGGAAPEVRLFDVQRVEALRGPQGTLYGAGSMAGTLRLIFNKPALDDYEGAAALQGNSIAGGELGYEAQGMANVPIVKGVLAVRIVGFYRQRGGWLENSKLGLEDFNDGTSKGGRIMVRFQPTGNLTLDGLATIQRTRGYNSNWYFPSYAAGGKPYDASYASLQPVKDDLDLYSLTAKWDVGFATVTGVTSYMERDLKFNFDTSAFFANSAAAATTTSAGCKAYNATGGANCTPSQVVLYQQYALGMSPSTAYQPQLTKSWSDELRISGNGSGPLNWTLGFFHSERKTDILSQVNAVDPATGLMITPTRIAPVTVGGTTYPATVFVNRGVQDNLRQIALFAEASYDITSRLGVTAGVRYFDYHKRVDTVTTLANYVVGAVPVPPASAAASEHGAVFKFNANYKLTSDVLLYANAAQGFRPGGVNQIIGLPDALVPYKSDSLWSYEIGAKTSWFDRALTLNADIFQIDWSDMQVAAQTPAPAVFSFITNAGKVRVQGAEVEVGARPVQGLTLQLSGSYILAKLRGNQVAPNGIIVSGAGLKGDYVPFTPKFSGQASVEYRYPAAGSIQPFFRADLAYAGESWTQFRRTNAAQQQLPDYTTVGVRLGIDKADDTWSLSLFANNLFNTVGIVNKSTSALYGSVAAVRAVSVLPRTVGIDLRMKF